MKLYKALVRVNGNIANEVRKDNLTAAEVLLLRRIHGNDAVSKIKETGATTRNDRVERERLAKIYSLGELRGHRLLQEVFGVTGIPLPQQLDFASEQTVIEDDVEEAAPAKGEVYRGPVPSGAVPVEDAQAAPEEDLLPVVDRTVPRSAADELTA